MKQRGVREELVIRVEEMLRKPRIGNQSRGNTERN